MPYGNDYGNEWGYNFSTTSPYSGGSNDLGVQGPDMGAAAHDLQAATGRAYNPTQWSTFGVIQGGPSPAIQMQAANRAYDSAQAKDQAAFNARLQLALINAKTKAEAEAYARSQKGTLEQMRMQNYYRYGF